MPTKSLERLILEFNKLPGVGQKSATRYAFHILNQSEEDVKKFTEALLAVKDNVTANKYIEMLKKNKTGIATFIPLDNIKIKNISNIKYENTLGYARDLVKNISGNESINKAINYVFSNAMVVEKIEDGLKLSKSLNDKIVSLDGDIISATGRITGGYNTRKIDNTLLKINELKFRNGKAYIGHVSD